MNKKIATFAIMLLLATVSTIQVTAVENVKNDSINLNSSDLDLSMKINTGMAQDNLFTITIKNSGDPVSYVFLSCKMTYVTLQAPEAPGFVYIFSDYMSTGGTFSNGLNNFNVRLPGNDVFGMVNFFLYIHFQEGSVVPCCQIKFLRIGSLVIANQMFTKLTFDE